MTPIRTHWCYLLLAGIAVFTGCNNCCRRSPPGVAPPPGYVPPPAYPTGPGAPPPAFPGNAGPPPGSVQPPPGAFQAPPPPVPTSPDVRSYGPTTTVPPAPNWGPSGRGDVRLSVPEPITSEQHRQSAHLAPPESMPPGPAASAKVEDRVPTPALPVGIPQFAMAREQVASGQKPFLDGLDWLQANGYRTVLHIRQAGEDGSADQRLVEKRGMRYLSLEVSPQTLTRQTCEEFNRKVADSSNYPLFVYDKDGMVAGGLWFVYFRLQEGATSDMARTKAARLGFREDPNGEHRALWEAVRRILGE